MKLKKILKRVTENRNVKYALILCVVMIAMSMAASFYVEWLAEERCFRILKETTEQGAADIRIMLRSDAQTMQTISGMLADYGKFDKETGQRYLDSLTDAMLISGYSLLFPDGQMEYSQNTKLTGLAFAQEPDFETESGKEAGLSDVFEDAQGEKYAAYVFPVGDEGACMAVLYGYINLQELPEKLALTAYDGQCQMYIIDIGNGDFLMDTWHETLGNAYDSEYAGRDSAKGYNVQEAWDNVLNGGTGHVVFTSKSSGDEFYTYYCPVGLYELSFQTMVPYQAAFADAIRIRNAIYLLAVAELAASLLYVALLLRRAGKKIRREQTKLLVNRKSNELQRMLLGAYHDPEAITAALKSLAYALGAEQVGFFVLEENMPEEFYGWPVSHKVEEYHFQKEFRETFQVFQKKHPGDRTLLVESGGADSERMLKISGKLLGTGVTPKNVGAACALDADGIGTGILFALDAVNLGEGIQLLELLAPGFQLAAQNVIVYSQLQYMGETDALTGLKNRNAYQKNLAGYEKTFGEGFCCIYIDANGLRELNNNFGHAFGDAMLKSVGQRLQEFFGAEHSYRIGGDEFVVFCPKTEKGQPEEKLARLGKKLEENDYHISVGVAYKERGETLHYLITDAEQKMYEEKRKFYCRHPKFARRKENDAKTGGGKPPENK